jgi:hypothetical protein
MIRNGKNLPGDVKRKELINFHEQVIKKYLDFIYFQRQFDDSFLRGIGYK